MLRRKTRYSREDLKILYFNRNGRPSRAAVQRPMLVLKREPPRLTGPPDGKRLSNRAKGPAPGSKKSGFAKKHKKAAFPKEINAVFMRLLQNQASESPSSRRTRIFILPSGSIRTVASFGFPTTFNAATFFIVDAVCRLDQMYQPVLSLSLAKFIDDTVSGIARPGQPPNQVHFCPNGRGYPNGNRIAEIPPVFGERDMGQTAHALAVNVKGAPHQNHEAAVRSD